MFLDAPHDAMGSPSRIYEIGDLFAKENIEIAYYAASFAYYRLSLMVSNNQIDRADGRLKWHVLTAMRYLALGELPLTATPSAIETACTKMLNAIWLPPKDSLKVASSAESVGQPRRFG